VVERGAGAAHGAVERDVEHDVPLLVGHLVQLRAAAEACVVDQHVDGAELRGRRREQRLHRPFVGDVARDSGDSESLGSLAQTPLVLVGDDDPRAFFDAPLCDRGADAGPRSRGDQDGLPIEQGMTGDVLRLGHFLPGKTRM
jgi:hypothetical protein